MITTKFLKSTPVFPDPIPPKILLKQVKLLVFKFLRSGTCTSQILLNKQTHHHPCLNFWIISIVPRCIHCVILCQTYIGIYMSGPVWHSQLSSKLGNKTESAWKRSLMTKSKIPYCFLLKAARITDSKKEEIKFAYVLLSPPLLIAALEIFSLNFTAPQGPDSPV